MRQFRWEPRPGSKTQFTLTAIHEGHCSTCLSMAMCPQDSSEDAAPLYLVVGTTSGYLAVYDLSVGSLFRRLYIHGSGVHGVTWIGTQQVGFKNKERKKQEEE